MKLAMFIFGAILLAGPTYANDCMVSPSGDKLVILDDPTLGSLTIKDHTFDCGLASTADGRVMACGSMPQTLVTYTRPGVVKWSGEEFRAVACQRVQ